VVQNAGIGIQKTSGHGGNGKRGHENVYRMARTTGERTMIDKGENKFKSFLESSKIGIGFYIPGCFDLSQEFVIEAYEHFKKTGENIIDDYAKLTYAYAHTDDLDNCLLEEDIPRIESILSGIKTSPLSSFISQTQISAVTEFLARSKRFIEYWKTYEYRRFQANLYLANPKVRKRIFEKCGKQCCVCGKTKRLSIDHIVSIAQGGGNEDSNLQVLCTKCNSSKGCK
jgi:hypothetical protein